MGARYGTRLTTLVKQTKTCRKICTSLKKVDRLRAFNYFKFTLTLKELTFITDFVVAFLDDRAPV